MGGWIWSFHFLPFFLIFFWGSQVPLKFGSWTFITFLWLHGQTRQSFIPMTDPWDWHIHLHGNHKFMPNVGKSSVHRAYGIWFRERPTIARILGAFQVTWNFELQQTCADLIPLWQTNIFSCMESIICQCQWCSRKSWWRWNCVRRLGVEQHWSKELKGNTYFQYKYIHPGNFICRPEMGGLEKVVYVLSKMVISWYPC